MRITYRGDYALKAVLDLASHYDSGVVTIHDLALHTDAPTKFLEQVLLDLKRGGFVESRRGKIGGYRLARHPSRITVGDVVRFIDGPLEPIGCLEARYRGCRDTKTCLLKGIWRQVGRATSQIVDTVTFADLAGRLKKPERAVAYTI